MDVESVLEPLLIVSLVVLPALAVTLRIALRPVVEAIVRMREMFVSRPDARLTEARMARMEDEMAELRAMVRRTLEAADFDRRLPGPTGAPSTGTPTSGDS